MQLIQFGYFINRIKETSLIVILIFVIVFFSGCYSVEPMVQKNEAKLTQSIRDANSFRLMFYNVENLFDVYDDSLKLDEEFLPDGEKHWTIKKYYDKINKIGKVITAVGGWQPPDIVGLCEVENRKCVNDIVYNSPVKNFKYKIIHKESPDRRGIDVALLYNENTFIPLEENFIKVNFPDKPDKTTRDILYVKGLIKKADTLHVFINHWPSRWGGMMESEEKRMLTASIVKAKTDSIFSVVKAPNIIIMGDLNDYPDNKSLTDVLEAKTTYEHPSDDKLYNLSYHLQFNKNKGSNKYQGEWGILDQIIISGVLLQTQSKLQTTIDNAHVYDNEFLLEKDIQHVGYKPFRTYIGYKYNGGFADHLPVYLDLFIRHNDL